MKTVVIDKETLSVFTLCRGSEFEAEIIANSVDVSGNREIDQDVFSEILARHTSKPTIKPGSKMGLGDAVALIAQPIAGAIDSVFGTNIKQCGGCAQRREALNRLVPEL